MKKERTYAFCGSVFFAFAVFFLSAGQVEAVVKGVCSNCHTMHNSQRGVDMVQDPLGGAFFGGDCQGCHYQPREELLTWTCVGCHAKSGGNAIDSPGVLDIPQVYYDVGTTELAAGNFKYIITEGDSSGHNVHGWGMIGGGPIIWPDPELDEPPGYVEDMDPSGWNFITDYPGVLAGRQVLCAGAFGCHGDRTIKSQTKATYGTHHANDSVLRIGHANFDSAAQGSTPGTSYRYLNGVKGGEISDWEENVSSASHNQYFGAIVGTRSSQSSVSTMSQFCASCHGNFHMAGLDDGSGITLTTDLASPWIRHPTDVKIPNSDPYDKYKDYELTARVARTALPPPDPAKTGLDTGGTAVVFCLSCHKAHASAYPDMLRFSYDSMKTGGSAGSSTGCFACHNDK